tara:strand:- start:27739 stop:27930 length:192 start_codon:yes stop_codon:yes gene_type:complete
MKSSFEEYFYEMNVGSVGMGPVDSGEYAEGDERLPFIFGAFRRNGRFSKHRKKKKKCQKKKKK